jgi:hypothetical protein
MRVEQFGVDAARPEAKLAKPRAESSCRSESVATMTVEDAA